MNGHDEAPHPPHETHGAMPGANLGHEHLGFELPPPATVSKSRLTTIGLVGLGVLGAAFAIGYLPRRHAAHDLAQEATAAHSARLRLEVVTPRPVPNERHLQLSGSVRPLEETVIYPRTSGYIRRWNVDIGDRVAEGQVLAEIETPELDRELAQARAQLAQAQATVTQAEANRQFANLDLERYRQLAPAGMASQQDFQQRQATASVNVATVAVAHAAVNAARANVQRLVELHAFERVTAPFAGTVTQRMIDRGALVTDGNATPLFHLAATDPVRVFVNVPQDTAPGVHAGIGADVTVHEYPGRTFHGTVSRAAGALDAASRTMNTEIRVPNGDGSLLAGMYADVALVLTSPLRAVELPATTVINDAHGVRVAVIGPDDILHLVPITIERDTGPTIQVVNGLRGDERVVRVASPQLSEGLHVDVAVAPTAAH